jgi:hypothetical protein
MAFDGMSGVGGLGMLVGLLFWAGVIALAIWGVVALFGRSGGPESQDSALEILRRRYARGELTDAEFEQAKQVLAADAPHESSNQHAPRATGTRRRTTTALVGALAAAAVVLGTTGVVLAQTQPGPWGPGGMMGGQGRMGGGMMGGQGPGGMMGGQGPGGMMGGMMGGFGPGGMMGGAWQGAPATGTALGSLADAQQAFQQYLDRFGNANLVLDEVMEFQNNFYAIVEQKDTGMGAFELLSSKQTGFVFPEPGPNMMWNTQYGHMGGFGGGMMGGWWGQAAGGEPTVSAERARELAQQWLDQYQPGSTTEEPTTFPGYYTLHSVKDGEITGMLSVHAYGGQVWYHTWHGPFVATTEMGH